MRIAVMIIFLMQQRVANAEFMQHSFIGVAFAMFLKNGFADHFGRHLNFNWKIIGIGKRAIVVDG